jgi:hypothetical protein
MFDVRFLNALESVVKEIGILALGTIPLGLV